MMFDRSLLLLVGAIFLLVILLDVIAIADLRLTDKSKQFKLVFMLVIIFVPFFGFSAYYIYKSISNWRQFAMNKKMIFLRIGVILPTLLFIYLYAIDPLNKHYNLIVIASIFTVLLLLSTILFKKNRLNIILSYYAIFGLLIISYLLL